MASFFGEIIEPSTRALFDDCSDDDIEDPIAVEIIWNQAYLNSLPKFDSLVIVDGLLTLAFVEAFLLDSKQKIVGKVVVKNSSKVESEKALSSPLVLQNNLLICFVQQNFPASKVFDFADLIAPLARSCQEVIVVTSQSLNSYKSISGDLPTENVVYSLATRKYKGEPLRPYLAEANIITGAPAGVLSWCESNQVPGVAYICYTDSNILDSITSKPLRGILPECQNNPNLKQRWIYGGATRSVGNLTNMYI